MVAALAESAAEQGRKVLIVTNQNSAAGSAVEKLRVKVHGRPCPFTWPRTKDHVASQRQSQ